MRLLEYATALNASGEVIVWLNTAAKASLKKEKIKEHELEHIIDWMVSGAAPQRLLKMSVVDAKRKADEWAKANQKKGSGLEDSPEDISDYMTFDDGFKIVELLTKNAFQREGSLMSNCLGGYEPKSGVKIYSLRDNKNQPHATFEIAKNADQVVQVKGKGNGSIHPKYVYKVIAFLEKNGMKIRPSEMMNLGYYHIHKDHLEFIKKQKVTDCKIVEVFGEHYAF